MVYQTAEYIRVLLNEFILNLNEQPPLAVIDPAVVLDNISNMEDPEFQNNNNIIVSIVNIEEESALKNRRAVKIVNGMTEYERPPITFNLYMLFSAKFESYSNALIALSRVTEFFQAKNCFNYLDDPPSENIPALSNSAEDIEKFLIHLDPYTLTFEQLNHLWGALGGKQVPSVMYKVRAVEVKRSKILSSGNIIERVRRENEAI